MRGTLAVRVAAVAIAALVPVTAAGQGTATLDLQVRSSIGQTLAYSAVEISSGLSRFTGETGRLMAAVPSSTTLRVRIKHLGYAAVDTTLVSPAEGRVSLTVTLEPIVVNVATTSIRARTSCRVLSDSDSELGRIVGELRKNAEREILLRTSYPFMYKLAREYEVTEMGREYGTTFTDTAEFGSMTNDPYIPGRLVRPSNRPYGTANRELRIPTLVDIADDRFLLTHCFAYRGVARIDGQRVHRIDFEPVPDLRTTDVKGSAFLDEKSFLIRRAVFRLDKGYLLTPPVLGLEVTTTYKEIFSGMPLINFIRGVQRVSGAAGARGERIEEQRLIGVRFMDRVPGGSETNR